MSNTSCSNKDEVGLKAIAPPIFVGLGQILRLSFFPPLLTSIPPWLILSYKLSLSSRRRLL